MITRIATALTMLIGLTLPMIVVVQEPQGWPATPEGATTYQIDHGAAPAVLLARAHQTAQTLMIGADAHARTSLLPTELVTRRGFDPATDTGAAILAAVEAQNGLTWIDPIVARNRSFNVGNELTKLITAGYTVGHAAAQDPDELQELLDQYAATLPGQIDAIKAERDQAIADRDALQQQLATLEAQHAQELANQRAAFEQQRAADIEAVRQFLLVLADRLTANE